MRTGSLNILSGSLRVSNGDEHNILAYGRFEGEDRVVVIVNNRCELAEVTVPVWLAEVPMKCRMKKLMYSYQEGYSVDYEEYLVEDGEVVVNMGAYSALVLCG